jgi:hypothetical protein
MINDGINDVPENTLVVITEDFAKGFSVDRVPLILSPSPKKRDWFTPHFYRCLPLVTGNSYGFIIKSEYSFSVEWNGGPNESDVVVTPTSEHRDKYPIIETKFGHGTFTLGIPFSLRTPPGINLMTINPPNIPIPNVSVMTGVIETDNLRRNFGVSIKLQMPNISVHFPAGIPLAALLPIPRYVGDAYKIAIAEEIFSDEIIKEERESCKAEIEARVTVDPSLPNRVNRRYFKGVDFYGNEFPDHQN